MSKQYKLLNRIYSREMGNSFFFELAVNDGGTKESKIRCLASSLYHNKTILNKLTSEEREVVAYFAGFDEAKNLSARMAAIINAKYD